MRSKSSTIFSQEDRLSIAKLIAGSVVDAVRWSLWFIAGVLLVWTVLTTVAEHRQPQGVFTKEVLVER